MRPRCRVRSDELRARDRDREVSRVGQRGAPRRRQLVPERAVGADGRIDDAAQLRQRAGDLVVPEVENPEKPPLGERGRFSGPRSLLPCTKKDSTPGNRSPRSSGSTPTRLLPSSPMWSIA